MRVLLFITGFRQVKEYDYFSTFLKRLNTLGDICDVFIYCNNPEISPDIVTYYKNFTQRNKHLYITSLNIGFGMGAVEAVSRGIEMGIFAGYDYVIHLHPDVFITAESAIIELLTANAANDCVFFVNTSEPDDRRFFSFDFFVFKPMLLQRNIFIDELHDYQDLPEHYLHDMLIKNGVKFKLVKRFENDRWSPRRIDEHLNLYHEHDLTLVEDLLKGFAEADGPPPTEVVGWQPPVVELHPSPAIKRGPR